MAKETKTQLLNQNVQIRFEDLFVGKNNTFNTGYIND